MKSATKNRLYVFFDKDSVIYWHVVPPHTMITTDTYIIILKSLCRYLRSKHLSRARSFILHHNNAPPHTATNKQPKRSRSYHIRLMVCIWRVVIFGCFQNCRNSGETRRFPQMRTSSWPATRYSLAFQLANLLKEFRSRSNVGRGALKSMVAILK